jgi:hypothetical protein
MTLFDTDASPGREEFNAFSEAEGPQPALNWRDAWSKELG